MTDFANLTEITPEGEQTVAPGVAPITLADRLAWRAATPLQPTQPQKPCDHGLFDALERNQLDLIEFLRVADSAASTSPKRKE